MCGPERVLSDSVLGAIREFIRPAETCIYQAGTDSEDSIWASVLMAGWKPWTRLVVVRHAQKLCHWRHLRAWMDDRVPVWLVLQSDEDNFPRDDEGDLAAPACWLRDSSLGHIVRCSTLDEDAAVAWACGRLTGLTGAQARNLLSRASGNLAEVSSVLLKARALDGRLPDAALALLCTELPGEFADLVIQGERAEAMLAAEGMGGQDLIRSIGLLASRLQVLTALHRAHRERLSLREVVTRLGVPAFLAQKYAEIARSYDEERVSRAWLALTAAEDAYRSGAESGGVPEGIAESLVLSWLGSSMA